MRVQGPTIPGKYLRILCQYETEKFGTGSKNTPRNLITRGWYFRISCYSVISGGVFTSETVRVIIVYKQFNVQVLDSQTVCLVHEFDFKDEETTCFLKVSDKFCEFQAYFFQLMNRYFRLTMQIWDKEGSLI